MSVEDTMQRAFERYRAYSNVPEPKPDPKPSPAAAGADNDGPSFGELREGFAKSFAGRVLLSADDAEARADALVSAVKRCTSAHAAAVAECEKAQVKVDHHRAALAEARQKVITAEQSALEARTDEDREVALATAAGRLTGLDKFARASRAAEDALQRARELVATIERAGAPLTDVLDELRGAVMVQHGRLVRATFVEVACRERAQRLRFEERMRVEMAPLIAELATAREAALSGVTNFFERAHIESTNLAALLPSIIGAEGTNGK